MNESIHAARVRLIGKDGEMIGVVSRQEGLAQAFAAGLDLVEISPNADPPVCKILDYGKYKYELQKKRNEAKKKQKVIEVKEIQMRPVIDDNDFVIKCKAIKRFLEEGNKVKVTMRFRGREVSHYEIGAKILDRVKEDFDEVAKVEQLSKLEGRQMVMVLAPK